MANENLIAAIDRLESSISNKLEGIEDNTRLSDTIGLENKLDLIVSALRTIADQLYDLKNNV